jgi:hypothetical protein
VFSGVEIGTLHFSGELAGGARAAAKLGTVFRGAAGRIAGGWRMFACIERCMFAALEWFRSIPGRRQSATRLHIISGSISEHNFEHQRSMREKACFRHENTSNSRYIFIKVQADHD